MGLKAGMNILQKAGKAIVANADDITKVAKTKTDDAIEVLGKNLDDTEIGIHKAFEKADDSEAITSNMTIKLSDEDIRTMPKALRYALEGKVLSTKEKNEIMRIQAKLTWETMTNISKYYKGQNGIAFSVQSIADDFLGSKGRLLEELKEILTPQQIKRIQKASTPEDLSRVLLQEEFAPYAGSLKAAKTFKSTNIPLEYEQMDYAARIKRADFILAREKAMYKASTNPRVVEIENILKEQYGCKLVSFRDDIETAENALKAFETAKKAKVKTPENIIISDFMVADGERIAPNNTVLLASASAKEKSLTITLNAMQTLSSKEQSTLSLMNLMPNMNPTSTNLPEHVVLHEIMHGTHPLLASFAFKKIPASLRDVKDNLSIYSALANTFETYTELVTKKVLVGLSPKETKLLDYLS